jgi:hypothetical protein
LSDHNHSNLFYLQTNHCGWGAVALEPLEKGDFVIEYVGEGIFILPYYNFYEIEIGRSRNFFGSIWPFHVIYLNTVESHYIYVFKCAIYQIPLA